MPWTIISFGEMHVAAGKPLYPFEVGMERALSRAETEGRSDDTPDAIAKRLAVYHEQTEPIVEHYRATGKLVPLHGDQTIEEVWAEVQAALDQIDGRAA
jgi:adenylate kinase